MTQEAQAGAASSDADRVSEKHRVEESKEASAVDAVVSAVDRLINLIEVSSAHESEESLRNSEIETRVSLTEPIETRTGPAQSWAWEEMTWKERLQFCSWEEVRTRRTSSGILEFSGDARRANAAIRTSVSSVTLTVRNRFKTARKWVC